MSHVLPNISQGRFFEPIFTSKKFDLYTSIYGKIFTLLHEASGCLEIEITELYFSIIDPLSTI